MNKTTMITALLATLIACGEKDADTGADTGDMLDTGEMFDTGEDTGDVVDEVEVNMPPVISHTPVERSGMPMLVGAVVTDEDSEVVGVEVHWRSHDTGDADLEGVWSSTTMERVTDAGDMWAADIGDSEYELTEYYFVAIDSDTNITTLPCGVQSDSPVYFQTYFGR